MYTVLGEVSGAQTSVHKVYVLTPSTVPPVQIVQHVHAGLRLSVSGGRHSTHKHGNVWTGVLVSARDGFQRLISIAQALTITW